MRVNYSNCGWVEEGKTKVVYEIYLPVLESKVKREIVKVLDEARHSDMFSTGEGFYVIGISSEERGIEICEKLSQIEGVDKDSILLSEVER